MPYTLNPQSRKRILTEFEQNTSIPQVVDLRSNKKIEKQAMHGGIVGKRC